VSKVLSQSSVTLLSNQITAPAETFIINHATFVSEQNATQTSETIYPRATTINKVCLRFFFFFAPPHTAFLICVRIVDQAPASSSNISTEDIPKSVARVLNATEIRARWKATLSKRKREEDHTIPASDHTADVGRKKKKRRTGTSPASTGKGGGGSKNNDDNNNNSKMLTIQPGESLSHFNK
jgi:hypothetical protein